MQPILNVMCGIPRCGKTTWISQNKGDACIVSPDNIRKLVFGHQFHAPANKFVFGMAESMASLLLEQGKNVIIDATNIFPYTRSPWRQIAEKNNAIVNIIWVYTDKDILQNLINILERNHLSNEDDKLPIEVLERMANSFVTPNADEEGNWFNVVEYLSVHKRSISNYNRIKVKRFDTIETVIQKWRASWHVAENKGNVS